MIADSPRPAPPRPVRSSSQAALRRRATELARHEIDFIPHPRFSEKEFGSRFACALPPLKRCPPPGNFPPHLARLCEVSLLAREDEAYLFERLNWARFRANSLRVRLDPDQPDAAAIRQIEHYLADARRVRDRIVAANMRLVIAIVKKFVAPQNSFDDLLSDGICSLMHAVDKFDCSRGFRFSTYAYRAISRSAYRAVTDRQKELNQSRTGAPESLLEAEEEGRMSSMDEATWNALRRKLSGMLGSLDRRERFIIRARYALGSHRKVKTFQRLADKLGISKERVRQLEQRAIAKLQGLAASFTFDEFGAPKPC